MLRRALAIMPAHAGALHLLGVLHSERNQFAPAVEFFRKAIAANPQSANSWLSLGMVLHRWGRREDAAAALRHALALDPAKAEVHYRLGLLLQDSGHAAEAEACLRTALVLDPNLIRPDNQLGAALFELGLYVSHRPDSDIIFKKHPELTELLPKWVLHNAVNNCGDIARLYALILNVKQVVEEGVAGDMAELGVFRGNSAVVLAHYARTNARRLYLFDTFDGFDARDLTGVDQRRREDFSKTSLEIVKHLVGEDEVVYVQGRFPQSMPPNVAEWFSVVHLDCDLYAPMRAGLEHFYPRLSPGGLLLLHDYSSGYFPGAKQAIDEYIATIPENLVLLPDKSGTAIIRKSSKS